MCVYGHSETHEWFCNAWRAAGKKLDMGKSCVRFKKLEDVPLNGCWPSDCQNAGQEIPRRHREDHREHVKKAKKIEEMTVAVAVFGVN